MQVGDDTPELTCPATTIPDLVGPGLRPRHRVPVHRVDPRPRGRRRPHLRGLVHPGRSRGSPSPAPAASVLRVAAADDATEGGTAVLSVTAGDSNAQEIRFRLDDAPPPVPAPDPRRRPAGGPVPHLRPGAPTSSRASPAPTPRSCPSTRSAARGDGERERLVGHLQGGPGRPGHLDLPHRDERRRRLRQPPSARPRAGSSSRCGGTPGAPGPPRPFPALQSNKISMGWEPPQRRRRVPDHGLRGPGAADQQADHLPHQRVRLRRPRERARPTRSRSAAVNKIGPGDWSDVSKSAYADTAPGTGREHPDEGARRPHDHRRVGPAHDRDLQGRSATPSPGSAPPQTVPGEPRPRWRPAASTTTPSTPSRSRRSTRSTTRRRARPSRSSPWAPRCRPGRRPSPTSSPGVGPHVGAGHLAGHAARGARPDALHAWPTRRRPGTQNVPGCVPVQATTCVHSGVDYDGTAYAYSVRAHNVAEHLRAEPARDLPGGGQAGQLGRLVGRPDRRQPAGARRRRRPRTRGASKSIAAILVGGQVVWENPVAAGQAINRGRAAPRPTTAARPGPAADVQRVRRPAAGARCSDVKTVQSYGPLRSGRLSQPTASVNGKTSRWTISGTSNGDAGHRSASASTAAARGGRALAGPGGFSFTRSVTVADFNDHAPRSRSAVRRRAGRAGRGLGVQHAASPAPPPPPTVAHRRADCSDDDGSDARAPRLRLGPVDPASTESAAQAASSTRPASPRRFRCEVVRGGRNGWFAGGCRRASSSGRHQRRSTGTSRAATSQIRASPPTASSDRNRPAPTGRPGRTPTSRGAT